MFPARVVLQMTERDENYKMLSKSAYILICKARKKIVRVNRSEFKERRQFLFDVFIIYHNIYEAFFTFLKSPG